MGFEIGDTLRIILRFKIMLRFKKHNILDEVAHENILGRLYKTPKSLNLVVVKESQ